MSNQKRTNRANSEEMGSEFGLFPSTQETDAKEAMSRLFTKKTESKDEKEKQEERKSTNSKK
ncbi:hypothetical protein ACI2JA_14370 [Alkalihalobacillus sp. NPDC078783]